MNENAKRWVEALRSGEYKQAGGALRRGDTFCCLGVVCDIARDELGIDWAKRGRDYYCIDGCASILPSSVQEWLGLRSDQGAYWNSLSLAGRNDAGASFAEIADIIESEPPGLFR